MRHDDLPHDGQPEPRAARVLGVEQVEDAPFRSAILPIPGSRMKYKVLDLVPNALSRTMTNDLRMGSFIVSSATKD